MRPAAWFTSFAQTPLQRRLRYYKVIRPCGALRYSMAYGYGPLARLPLHRSDTFPRSAQGPKPHSRHLSAGGRSASKQVPANLVPGPRSYPGFDHHLTTFDTSSVVHLHSTLRLTPDRILPRPFPNTLTTTPLKCRSCGWFTTPACTAIVGGLPPSLTQFGILRLSHNFTSVRLRGTPSRVATSSILHTCQCHCPGGSGPVHMSFSSRTTGGLPLCTGGSASTLSVSRPARHSLRVPACMLAESPKRSVTKVLQSMSSPP